MWYSKIKFRVWFQKANCNAGKLQSIALELMLFDYLQSIKSIVFSCSFIAQCMSYIYSERKNSFLSSVCFFYQTHFSDKSIGCYVDTGSDVLELGTSYMNLVPNGRSNCATFCFTHCSYQYFSLQVCYRVGW